jgi:hypothetical protein
MLKRQFLFRRFFVFGEIMAHLISKGAGMSEHPAARTGSFPPIFGIEWK